MENSEFLKLEYKRSLNFVIHPSGNAREYFILEIYLCDKSASLVDVKTYNGWEVNLGHESGRTLLCVEDGYPKGSSDTNG
jgi:hypothetical protein